MNAENLARYFSQIWEFLKTVGRILRILLLTFKNIVMFFKDPQRLTKLGENRNLLAVCLKEKQTNGKFNVIECLYDNESEKIVSTQYNTQGIFAENLDDETKVNFGNKDMIILN